MQFQHAPGLAGLKALCMTEKGRGAKKSQTLPVAAHHPLRWYLEQLVWGPEGGQTTVVEMAIDFWLATRISLSTGTTIVDRTRAFKTAALKVALLGGGRMAPVPFKVECGNLGRLFYSSVGFVGRAKLLFAEEAKIILAIQQKRAGIANAAQPRRGRPVSNGDGSRRRADAPCRSRHGVLKTRQNPNAVRSAGTGRAKGETRRCVVDLDDTAAIRTVSQGKQRRGMGKGRQRRGGAAAAGSQEAPGQDHEVGGVQAPSARVSAGGRKGQGRKAKGRCKGMAEGAALPAAGERDVLMEEAPDVLPRGPADNKVAELVGRGRPGEGLAVGGCGRGRGGRKGRGRGRGSADPEAPAAPVAARGRGTGRGVGWGRGCGEGAGSRSTAARGAGKGRGRGRGLVLDGGDGDDEADDPRRVQRVPKKRRRRGEAKQTSQEEDFEEEEKDEGEKGAAEKEDAQEVVRRRRKRRGRQSGRPPEESNDLEPLRSQDGGSGAI